MIEAELKARVESPETVLKHLSEWTTGRTEVYQDTYYDDPNGGLEARDQELRVRTVRGEDSSRTLLTFKGAAVDAESGSKPEQETRVEDADAVHAVLRGLGYVPVIRFEKHCRNYDFEAHGRRMLATLVRIPEIDGTFLELETLADERDLTAALDAVRSVLTELGLGPESLTRELYTDAVRRRRTEP